jgi:hypothetical protein
MDPTEHPGPRLRAFRETRHISLRDAARQLHTVHPALKDWEERQQVPTQPFRDAIEVWTQGEIRAAEWPLSMREREIIANAAQVVAAVAKVPPAPKSAPDASADDTGERAAVSPANDDADTKRDTG